jgi:hypothetical protein
MSIFTLSHFPLCHDDGGITYIPMTEFDEIESGIFRRKGNKKQVDFRDSLKTSMCHSLDSLLASYSNKTYHLNISLSIGNITRVEVPLPCGYEIYSVPIPTAVMGNVDKGEHCFPSIFGIDRNIVLIGTTAHQIEGIPIGNELELTITVYCYKATDAPGWRKLLYSGLSNLSKGNTSVSVLLLATAIELYADDLFSKYLKKKGVDDSVRKQTVKSVRSWHLKAKRISGVLEITMPNYDPKAFKAALKEFQVNAKDPRNKYAHEDSEELTRLDAHKAYCAVFDLLWFFDSLDTILTTK